MLLFAASAMTFTACNKQKVSDEMCNKECCADKEDKCKKDCKEECCNAESHKGCEPGCEKPCCKGADSTSAAADTSAKAEAHVCDDNCRKNGCTHKS